MKKPFDIFWFGDNGPNWIETVETLEIAKARIENLPQANKKHKIKRMIDTKPVNARGIGKLPQH